MLVFHKKLAYCYCCSVGGNGGGTLQKNGHIVDYVQTLKRSQDEIFRKVCNIISFKSMV